VKNEGSKKQLSGLKKREGSDQVTSLFGVNDWKILNIALFSGDMNRVLNIIGEKLDLGTKKYWIATVNPEFVMEAQKDDNFARILRETNLNVVDGIGLVWARRVLENSKGKLGRGLGIGMEILRGKYRNQLASGADLIESLAKMAQKKGLKIFFLGGFGDRAQKTAINLTNRFDLDPKQVKWSAGEPYVENKQVIEEINQFKPDILLVAYGMKKQEMWIDKNLADLNVGVVMGVGRSFDYYSGELKRAPEGWRRLGLEWLYSLLQEPKRIKRQLALLRFVWKVLLG